MCYWKSGLTLTYVKNELVSNSEFKIDISIYEQANPLYLMYYRATFKLVIFILIITLYSLRSFILDHKRYANVLVYKAAQNEKRKNETREMIEKMFNDGVSYRAIATALNANNIPTISGRGQWYAQKIHLEVKLLKEEKR